MSRRFNKVVRFRYELTLSLNNGTMSKFITFSKPFALQVSRFLKRMPCVEYVSFVECPIPRPVPSLFSDSLPKNNDEIPF